MKNTFMTLPEFDFREGFRNCSCIAPKGQLGKRHEDFIVEFNAFDEDIPELNKIKINEDTLRNWLYRKCPKYFIPRWDITFKLCRVTRCRLSRLWGVERKLQSLIALTGLSRETFERLRYFGQQSITSQSELDDNLPRRGVMINYILQDDFIRKTVIPVLIEYEEQLVRLLDVSPKSNSNHDLAISIISEIHIQNLIRNIQPDIIDFVQRFASVLKNGKELTAHNTEPIHITKDCVDPREAFQIGLHLAVYHQQHPDDIRYGARALLKAKASLPPVNIHKFRNALNIYIEEHKLNLDPVAYSSVHGWISGKFIPKPSYLRALCGFFSCDIDYLFGCQRFAQYEYDLIHFHTGFSNILCEWIHDLSSKERSIVEHLVCNEQFHILASHMETCFHFSQSKSLEDIGGKAVKQAILTSTRGYGTHLYELAKNEQPIPDAILRLAMDSCRAAPKYSKSRSGFTSPYDEDHRGGKNQPEHNAFIYAYDKETLISEYALNALTKQVDQWLGDLLYTIQSSYLDSDGPNNHHIPVEETPITHFSRLKY